jgi:hypothetical protein
VNSIVSTSTANKELHLEDRDNQVPQNNAQPAQHMVSSSINENEVNY